MKIVLATANRGKIAEIKNILDMPGVTWLTQEAFGDWPDIVEDGPTFQANAEIKARAVAQKFDLPALADDSGLEVDALGGRPGVRSARYAGPNASDADNVAKLLDELADTPAGERTARFVAVVVVAWPDGRTESAAGFCRGTIAAAPRGEGGFGYDPVFVPEGMDRTMAELAPSEKNEISHRGRALRLLRDELHRFL
jgi:XTP/dITP diphosphohydrolase